MATSLYTYQPFHTIGEATLQIWDSEAGGGSGGWLAAGKITDAAVNIATDQITKEVITQGLTQPVAQRNQAKRFSLSFRLLENANPRVLDMLFGDGADQVSQSEGTAATAEVIRLYSSDYSELSHPHGIVEVTPPVVKSYDGLTTYVLDTDYTTDLKKGIVKRKTGGSIADGAQVYISYSYTRPAGVETSMGEAVDLERYRKVRLLQLSVDNTAPADLVESGLEFEFTRVNITGGDSSIPLGADDFSEGASISWDCMYDSSEARVGTVRSSFGVLAQY